MREKGSRYPAQLLHVRMLNVMIILRYNQELEDERTAGDTIVARVLARRQCMYPETPEAREISLQQGKEVRHRWDSYIDSTNEREG